MRTQSCKIDSTVSSNLQCSAYGVPQGSILGPTLFIIYINDLCNLQLRNAAIVTYADDTAIVFHGKTWQGVQKNIQDGLSSVVHWFKNNLLTLNLKKSKYVTFSIRSNGQPQTGTFTVTAHSCVDPICCSCPSLEQVHEIKYLGVILDKHLNWISHIKSLSGRVRKLIFIFKQLRHIADEALLKMVYFAFAQSILTYCIYAWGGASKTHMIHAERSQRALLKVSYFKPFRYPTSKLYTDTKVLTVRGLYIRSVILKQHTQIAYDPVFFCSTRRNDKVCRITHKRTSFAQNFHTFLGPFLYNKINKIINLYQNTFHSCKRITVNYIESLNYDEIEGLLNVEN